MGTKYYVDGDDLISVANHIRAKGGTAGSLVFPAEFNDAIDNLAVDTFEDDDGKTRFLIVPALGRNYLNGNTVNLGNIQNVSPSARINIDFGDGTASIIDDPSTQITHTYSDINKEYILEITSLDNVEIILNNNILNPLGHLADRACIGRHFILISTSNGFLSNQYRKGLVVYSNTFPDYGFTGSSLYSKAVNKLKIKNPANADILLMNDFRFTYFNEVDFGDSVVVPKAYSLAGTFFNINVNIKEVRVNQSGTYVFQNDDNGRGGVNLKQLNIRSVAGTLRTGKQCAGIRCIYIKPVDPAQNAISFMDSFTNATTLVALVIDCPTLQTLSSASLTGTPIANNAGYIYVPDELVESYKTATNWSTYSTSFKGISELPTEFEWGGTA